MKEVQVCYHITEKAFSSLFAATKASHPFETCSFLFSDNMNPYCIIDLLLVTNVRRAIGEFAITKSDYEKAKKTKEKSMVGIYHSHPFLNTTPSEEDEVMIMKWPQHVFIIGSLNDNSTVLNCNAYKYNNNLIEKIEFERIDHD